MNLGLKAKLSIMTVALLVLAVAAVGYFSYTQGARALLDDVVKNMEQEAILYGDSVDRFLASRQGDCRIISRHPVIASAATSSEEKSAVLKMFKQDLGCYDSISFVTADGVQTADSDGHTGVTKDSKEWFQVAIQGKSYMSDVRMSQDLQKPVISLAEPVYDAATGELLGVVTARLSMEDTIWQILDECQVLQEQRGRTGAYAFLLNREGTIIAHPDKSKVLKENVLETGDADLKAIVKRMINGESGQGHYTYEGVSKRVAFAPLDGFGDYEGQGWSVGLTFADANVARAVAPIKYGALVAGLIAAVIGVLAAILLASRIINPIKEMVSRVERVADGDLTIDLDVRGSDEVGVLGRAFNQMIRNLRDMTTALRDKSASLAASAQQLSANAEETSAGASETSSAMNEVASTVERTAQNTQMIREAAEAAANEAEKGRKGIEKVTDQMGNISSATDKVGQAINNLTHMSEKIGVIVETITNIADQTNLLALNAAIEAARAGEQGRGFAVVAEEVRKLAEQSANAAQEIQQLIASVQAESKQASEAMDQGANEVQEGVNVVNEVGQVFAKIINKVKGLAEQVDEIASGTEQISSAIQNVASTTEESTAAMEEIASSTEALTQMADELQKMAAQFKVDGTEKFTTAPEKKRQFGEQLDGRPSQKEGDARE
ncbi:MAG: methyl-accepting chemotaxis protein [Peptococcaceae bacterium]|nr:methyl-accepting chemotaxis protein [Peptococcaceae bacterium]